MRFATRRPPASIISNSRICGLHRSHFFFLLVILIAVPFLWWSTSELSDEESKATAATAGATTSAFKWRRWRYQPTSSSSSSTDSSSSSSSEAQSTSSSSVKAAATTTDNFKVDPQAQELSNRIMEMNGLYKRKGDSEDSSNRWVGPKSSSDDSGFSPILPAPKVGEHEYSEQDSLLEEAENCPPVEAPPDMDLIEFFGQGHKYDVTTYLPRIPSLYEPHAPKALWLPPIPISKNKDSPSLFNIHPVTGKSSSKIVWNTYANMDPASAAADLPFHKRHLANGGVPINLQAGSPEFAPRSLLNPEFLPGPPMTCDRLALRTRAYWQSWSKQTMEQKPLNVLVWHGTWTKATTEAKAGGPMGELGFFTSTMLALTALSAKVTFLVHPQSESEMLQAIKNFATYDIILIADTNSSSDFVLSQHGYFEIPDVLCRIRALDWGAAADRQKNSLKLPNSSQYIVPFSCGTQDRNDASSSTTPLNTPLFMHRYKNLAKEDDVESFEPSEASHARAKAEHEADMEHESHRLKFTEAEKLWPVAKDPHFFDNTANLHPRGATWDLLQGSSIEASGYQIGKYISKANPGGDANYANLFHHNKLSFHGRKKYAKRFQILVWGKADKDFEGLRPLLKAIAEIVPLVTIVKEASKRLFPDVSDLPRTVDGYPRIRHMGILNPREMQTLLEESALLMGIGDPIFSFTPLEGLQVGTPYLNPNFVVPLAVKQTQHWMNSNGDCTLTSQHPYAEKLGAPQTWNYNIRDLKHAQLVVRTALKWVHDTQKVLGGIPSLYPKELEFKHLVKRLNENFRTDFCEQQGRKPTPAHRKY